ncbi:MAG: hypothetical protein D6B26_00410, partial [Spirochaetaceae bacterium]
MKKQKYTLPLLLLILFLTVVPAYAIDDPFADQGIQESFSTFSTEVAAALPMNSMIGLNWSHSHIGQLFDLPPRFGVGVAVGATTMPLSAVRNSYEALSFGESGGADPFAELAFLDGIGMPIPGAVIDARIGGFLLPFDIGIKAGYLPPSVATFDDIGMEYQLLGADVRFRIVEGRKLKPTVSAGIGVNYLQGGLTMANLLEDDID